MSSRSSKPLPEPRERLADVLACVRTTEVRSGRLITDVLAGGFRSTFRGAGVEFSEVREYVEGDDPRTVDWNVTARVGRPMVKRFVEERERTIVFALDVSAGMAAGFGAWSLRQAASRFCACLGLAAIHNHDRVGLLAAGERLVRLSLPKKGGGHVLRVLRDVVELPERAGPADLDVLFATAAGRLRRRVVLFVLSDFAGSSPWRSLLPCAHRHDVVAVRLLAPERLAPPPALLSVADPVAGGMALVDFAHAPTRQQWLARERQQRHVRDEQFGRAGVDVVDLVLPMVADVAAIAQPLQRFFHRRAVREVKR
jgi:uncharacterized protein (DUF58 family)